MKATHKQIVTIFEDMGYAVRDIFPNANLTIVQKNHVHVTITNSTWEYNQIDLNKNSTSLGPYGCRCQTLQEYVLGDGCDTCNPELAKELNNE